MDLVQKILTPKKNVLNVLITFIFLTYTLMTFNGRGSIQALTFCTNILGGIGCIIIIRFTSQSATMDAYLTLLISVKTMKAFTFILVVGLNISIITIPCLPFVSIPQKDTGKVPAKLVQVN